MKKKTKVLAIAVTFFSLSVVGIFYYKYLHSFDIHSPTLTEREALLASVGATTNFIFELSAGRYDLQLHRYQFGKLLSTDTLNLIQWADEDNSWFPELTVSRREPLVISATRAHDNSIVWEIALKGMSGIGTPFHDIDSPIGLQQGRRTGRFNAEENPLAIAYYSMVSLNESDQSFSFHHFLDDILFSPTFRFEEHVPELEEISDIFIVSLQKLE